jgi:hypothetical protein
VCRARAGGRSREPSRPIDGGCSFCDLTDRSADLTARNRVRDARKHRGRLQLVEAGLQTLVGNAKSRRHRTDHQLERTSSVEALEKVSSSTICPKLTTPFMRRRMGRYGAWLESVTPYGLETVVG